MRRVARSGNRPRSVAAFPSGFTAMAARADNGENDVYAEATRLPFGKFCPTMARRGRRRSKWNRTVRANESPFLRPSTQSFDPVNGEICDGWTITARLDTFFSSSPLNGTLGNECFRTFGREGSVHAISLQQRNGERCLMLYKTASHR